MHSESLFMITISRIDGCNEETFMGVDWPETNLGVTANVPCPCTEFAGSLAGRALRYCGGTYSRGGRWMDSADISDCSALNSEITRRLCDVAKVRIYLCMRKTLLMINDEHDTLNEQSGNVTLASEVVVELTSKPEQLTAVDVSTGISILTDLLGEEALNNSKVHTYS